MFSYNCEKCGREVPPAYSECPDCAEKEKKAGGVTAAAMPTAAPIGTQAPPSYPPQPGQTYPQPPYSQTSGTFAQAPGTYPPPQQLPQQPPPPPPPQQAWTPPAGLPVPQQPPPPTVAARNVSGQPASGTPGWVISLLVGGVLVLGGYILITKGLPWWRGQVGDSAATASESSDAPVAASAPASKTAAVKQGEELRFLEVTGLRLTEEGKKPQISMIVVNHAAAELTDVKATVLIHTTKDKPGDAPLAKLELKLGSIEANDVRDIKMPFPTKLRAYELPDWQFLRAEIVAN